jgi:hypothetical protein
MDVHKEAIVIAVLNESGKLVMESVIETKASSILQFLHGLRGELDVNSGPTVAWALRPATVRNIASCADNCNVRKNRNRFAVSIGITTMR